MSYLDTYYRGKTVLLTGHTGFKGTWLTRWLNTMGATVVGCSLKAPAKSLYSATNGDQHCTSHLIDIRDADKLTALVDKAQPDFIFHFAAQSLVGESYSDPLQTFSTNTMGTANLLNALFKLRKPCAVVVTTTDKVYENMEWLYPYRETDRLGGHDPYSCSKAAAELVVKSYRQSFFPPEDFAKHGIAIAAARAGNVIGGGDWNKDHLVPDIVNAVSCGKPVALRNPGAVRPWQHVLDPLHGYLLLGARLTEDPIQASSEWNFGPLPTEILSVKQFTEKAIALWGETKTKITSQQRKIHEANLLLLDSSKADSLLSWQPQLDVHKAIDWTLKWYRNQLNQPERADDLVAENINNYERILACR